MIYDRLLETKPTGLINGLTFTTNLVENTEFLEDGTTPNPAFVKQEENGGDAKQAKTFTEEEHQAELNRIAAKTREEEKKKSESAIQKAREEAKAEGERLAKLTADEKEKEFQERQKTMQADKEKQLTLRENKLEAIDKLNGLSLPISFSDFFVHEDREIQDKNIDVFAVQFKEAVSKEVANELKGPAQKNVSNGNSNSIGPISKTF